MPLVLLLPKEKEGIMHTELKTARVTLLQCRSFDSTRKTTIVYYAIDSAFSCRCEIYFHTLVHISLCLAPVQLNGA